MFGMLTEAAALILNTNWAWYPKTGQESSANAISNATLRGGEDEEGAEEDQLLGPKVMLDIIIGTFKFGQLSLLLIYILFSSIFRIVLHFFDLFICVFKVNKLFVLLGILTDYLLHA